VSVRVRARARLRLSVRVYRSCERVPQAHSPPERVAIQELPVTPEVDSRGAHAAVVGVSGKW
jgi:hypothetical protein